MVWRRNNQGVVRNIPTSEIKAKVKCMRRNTQVNKKQAEEKGSSVVQCVAKAGKSSKQQKGGGTAQCVLWK